MREHEWVVYRGLPCCKKCGAIMRLDGNNKLCRGVVGVKLRPAQGDNDEGDK